MVRASNMRFVDRFTMGFAERKVRNQPDSIRAWDRYFDCFEHRFGKSALAEKRKMMADADGLTTLVSGCGGEIDTRLGITYLAIKSGELGTEEIFSWIRTGVLETLIRGMEFDASLLIRVAYDELDATKEKDSKLLEKLAELAKGVGMPKLAQEMEEYLENADK